MVKQAVKEAEEEIVMLVSTLRAPVSLAERLDRFRNSQPRLVKPGRAQAIRYILHQFLLKEEERAKRAEERKRAKLRREPKKKPRRSVSAESHHLGAPGE
jgi:hypothetical protein